MQPQPPALSTRRQWALPSKQPTSTTDAAKKIKIKIAIAPHSEFLHSNGLFAMAIKSNTPMRSTGRSTHQSFGHPERGQQGKRKTQLFKEPTPPQSPRTSVYVLMSSPISLQKKMPLRLVRENSTNYDPRGCRQQQIFRCAQKKNGEKKSISAKRNPIRLCDRPDRLVAHQHSGRRQGSQTGSERGNDMADTDEAPPPLPPKLPPRRKTKKKGTRRKRHAPPPPADPSAEQAAGVQNVGGDFRVTLSEAGTSCCCYFF